MSVMRSGRRGKKRGAIGRYLGALALVALALAQLWSPATAAAAARLDILEVRTKDFPTITLTFSANGADGLPLAGLDQRSLQVYEAGAERAVVTAYPLRNTTTPLSVMLALDTSGGMKDGGKLDQAKAAAKTFIAQMRSVDRLGLIQFDSGFTLAANFSSDRVALAKKVDGLTAQGNTRLYDALYLAIGETSAVSGSKAVVLLTDGQDTESATELAQVLALARERGVKIYAVGIGDEVDERVLRQIAQASGGYYYWAPTAQDIVYAFRLMSDQLRNRYELTYQSETTAAEGTKLDLRVVATTPEGQITGTASYLRPAYIPRQRAVPSAIPSLGTPAVRLATISERQMRFSAAAVALGIFLACLGLVWSRSQSTRQQRLRAFVSSGEAAPEAEDGESLLASLGLGGLRLLTTAFTRLLPPSQVRKLSHKLLLAGSPFGWRVRHFVTVKLVAGIAGIALGLIFFLRAESPLRGIVTAVTLTALGYALPNIWLGRRIKARQRSILRSLPDALDLLTISIEAGLGLDGALLEVVNKWDNALSREFAIMLAELQMGRNRKEALRGLAHRTGVPEVRTFASALIQADELGMGIARPLAIQAQQLRLKRRQFAEKLAREASIKMVMVMGVFIMPALFILVLSPAILQLQSAFKR